MAHTEVGLWGEQIAADYLLRHGYTILARRWRALRGDIDLVAEIRGEVVFVEVKTRKTVRQGAPEESVTWSKQRQLIKLAQIFMARHDPSGQTNFRIDVVAIEVFAHTHTARIRHLPSAVRND